MNVKQEARRIREQMETDRLWYKKIHLWTSVFIALSFLFVFLTVLVWLFKS